MRFNRRSLSAAAFTLASAAVIFAACTDRGDSPIGPEEPKGPRPEPEALAIIQCRASVAGREVSCSTPSSREGGPAFDAIYLGNQGVNVQVHTSNVSTPPHVADTTLFQFDLAVRNLIPQAIGTTDGTTADPNGIRVFFANHVNTTGGSGTVTVHNPDGYYDFTQQAQEYFEYETVLDSNEVSSAKQWQLKVAPGVTNFSFILYVQAPVQFPQGWVDVTPDTTLVAPGQKDTVYAKVKDAYGRDTAGVAVSWSSANTTIATVASLNDTSAEVTGVAAGTVTINAQAPSPVRAPPAPPFAPPYDLRRGSATVVVNTAPLVADTTIQAISNVTIPIAAPGLTNRITDPESDAGIIPDTVTTAKGGIARINANGSFDYLSKAGFAGEDTIYYQVEDGAYDRTGKVIVQVAASNYWYVQAGAAGTPDGRDRFPFASIAAAQDSAGTGDTIFVLAAGATQLDGPAALENSQGLIGQGIPTSITRVMNGSNTVTILAAGAAPGLTRTSAGPTVTVAQNNTIAGLGITAADGAAITGTGFGTLTVSSTGVNPAGPALHLTTGTLAASFDLLSSTGSTTSGLFLSGVGGTLTSVGGHIQSAADGIEITGTPSGSLTVASNLTLPAKGINVHDNTGGTISFTGAGKALSTGANAAVTLANNGGATVTFGGGGLAISTTAGAGFSATGGGTVMVTGANNTVQSTTGAAVTLNGVGTGASGLSFFSVSANGAPNGISLASLTGAGFQVTGDGATAGTGGTIQNTTGNSVALASLGSVPVKLEYLNVTGAGAAGSAGLSASAADSVKVAGTSVSATGGPALSLQNTGVYGTFSSVSSANSASSGVILNNVGGSFTMTGGSITNPASTAFAVIGGAGAATYGGSVTQPNAFALLSVTGGHTGALTFTGTLSAALGTGLQFDNADGTYNLNGATTLNGGDAGVDVLNGSGGSFSFKSGTSITNATGVGLNVASSAPTLLEYLGSISTGTGKPVRISNTAAPCGTITVGGTTESTGNGIEVTGCSGGTVTFNGGLKKLVSGTNDGVSLTSNPGATIAFAADSLQISTTNGFGFFVNATGGTVSVTGTANTIATTTGTPVSVNSAIGAPGMQFRSISNTSSTFGIVLANTGSAGGFTVTGVGSTNGSGGTLTATQSGVSVSNATGSISLANMDINGGASSSPRRPLTLSNFGTLNVTNVALASPSGPVIDASTGTLAGTFRSVTSTNTLAAFNPVNLNATGGTFSVNGGSITGTASTGAFVVTGSSNPNITWNGDISMATAGKALVSVSSSNPALTFNGTLSATNGTGIQFSGAGGSAAFNGTTTLNGGDAGVDVTGSSTATITFVSSATITNPTNEAINIASSSANLTYPGRITKTNGTTAITASGNSGGTISLGSRLKTLTTTLSSTAVNLTNNSGATINSLDSLVITTDDGTGYNATGGGTVNVSGANNTITSTGGIALNVTGTTIGASNLTFKSISANGGSNGIVLNGTGSGGLTVAGTGSAGSGGTIQNISGSGVQATSAQNLSLSWMNLTNANTTDGGVAGGTCGNDNVSTCNGAIDLTSVTGVTLSRLAISGTEENGIVGNNVTNFSMSNTTIASAGDDAAEHGIKFLGLFGTSSITSSTVSGSAETNFRTLNTSGTLNLTVTGSTFSNNSSIGGDGFLVDAQSTANVTVNVSNSAFTANRDDHINVTAANSAVVNATLTGNKLTGGHATATGQGIALRAGGSYSGTFTYDINADTITGAIPTAINVGFGSTTGTGLLRGKIRNNVVGTSGVTNSGSAQGSCILAEANGTGTGTHTTSITGNILRRCFDKGIDLLGSRDGSNNLNATVTGNNVSELVDPSSRWAIRLESGSSLLNETGSICADIANNTLAAATIGDEMSVRARSPVTLRFPGYTGGTTDNVALQNYLQGRNPAGGTAVATNSSGATFNNTSPAGSACPTPP